MFRTFVKNMRAVGYGLVSMSSFYPNCQCVTILPLGCCFVTVALPSSLKSCSVVLKHQCFAKRALDFQNLLTFLVDVRIVFFSVEKVPLNCGGYCTESAITFSKMVTLTTLILLIYDSKMPFHLLVSTSFCPWFFVISLDRSWHLCLSLCLQAVIIAGGYFDGIFF